MHRTGRQTALFWAVGVALSSSTIACGSTPTAPAAPRPANTVSGVVTETAGGERVPVEGAVVRHSATGRSATTDSGGRYAITELPGSMATIIAIKDGYENAVAMVAVFGEARLDLQMVRRREPPGPPALFGVVYEKTAAGEAPIAGALVEDSMTHMSTVTDAAGRYRLDFKGVNLGNTDGFVHIYVAKEGFQTFTRWVVPEGDTRLDIELVR